MKEFRLDLKATASQWPALAEENIASLGEGWLLAERMAELHSRALSRISRDAGSHPAQQYEASLLLGGHGRNLFIEFMSLVVRGRFDVASHLLRAILDAQSLAFATGSNAELAAKFVAGELRGADGRKLVADFIRPIEPELADFLDHRFKDESNAANDLSHVNYSHVDKILERSEDVITPVVGGRVDAHLARHMCGAALEHEYWHLVWLSAFRGEVLGEDWRKEFELLSTPFRGWMKEVFGATGYNADTNSWDSTKTK